MKSGYISRMKSGNTTPAFAYQNTENKEANTKIQKTYLNTEISDISILVRFNCFEKMNTLIFNQK